MDSSFDSAKQAYKHDEQATIATYLTIKLVFLVQISNISLLLWRKINLEKYSTGDYDWLESSIKNVLNLLKLFKTTKSPN